MAAAGAEVATKEATGDAGALTPLRRKSKGGHFSRWQPGSAIVDSRARPPPARRTPDSSRHTSAVHRAISFEATWVAMFGVRQ